MIRDRFDGHPFFSHFWYVNYYRAYYARAPLYVMTARDDSGSLVGGMPMVLGRRRMAGVPLKEARLLAGAHSHLNRIFVSPDSEDVISRFLRQLLDEGVDLIYFEDLPDVFPDRGWMEDYCRQQKLPVEVRAVRFSPYIPTTGTFEDYRKLLSKKFRELLNNRLNRINRAGGFEIRTFETSNGLDDILGDMRDIAAGSWQGQSESGMFSNSNNEQFYINLIRHALENQYGCVFILYFGGRPAAFEFHVYHAAVEYCLKSEYSQVFEKVSPGGVLDLELVKRAFASTTETYDLLGFEDAYKLRWTGHRAPYLRFFIFNRSSAARAAYLLYYRLGNRLRKSKVLRRLKDHSQAGWVET